VGDVTRVAIEVTGDFEIRSDRLHNPERVYYDILRSRPMIESRRIYSRSLDDKLVKRIRVAEPQPGITRVVLDLNGDAEPTASKLTNPTRLIVELRAANPVPAPVPVPAEAPPTVTSAPAQPPAAPLIRQAPPKIESPLPAKTSSNPPVRAELPENVVAEPSKAQLAKTDTPALVVGPSPPPRQPAPAATGPDEVGKAARHTTAGESSLVRTLGLKLSRVVIDAGHGGHDQGTEGPHGLLEKDLVLDVALRLGKLIESRMGAEVIYTRSDDTFVPLEGRTALANEKKADLFLSIHANSSRCTTSRASKPIT
jgi:N-acetylmuramoyl-L-alanine amidase